MVVLFLEDIMPRKHNCIDCGKIIYDTYAIRCQICHNIKRKIESKPRSYCVDCGKVLANRCAKRCARCFIEKPKKSYGWVHQGVRLISIDSEDVLEHRYIMEQYLGRPLEFDEIVHHINRNRLDNRIENLQLMTKGEHTTLHNTGKSRKGKHSHGWTPEQREKYLIAFTKRHPATEETRKKISENVKRIRSERFWSSRHK
jgi:hypothetical protein